MDYQRYIDKNFQKIWDINIDPESYARMKQFRNELIKAKLQEADHQRDHDKEYRRWETGLCGEIAIEKLLNIKFMDQTIGDSKNYNHPDLWDAGYNVGIKTVECGKYPIIWKKNSYPQIICLYDRGERIVHICGLATPDVLNTYQNMSKVLSPNIRAKGYKTAFVGFEELLPINSIKDLEPQKI